MAKYIEAILRATREAGSLCSKVAESRMDRVAAYDRFKETVWGATFKNLLGGELAKIGLTRILDVGCGKMTTFANIVHGHDPARFRYTSIDKDRTVHAHICADALVDVEIIRTQLGEQRFDMLILDVEPHGKETELLDTFKEYMDDEYIVVFKCVACMDLYGAGLGHRALKHMKDNMNLIDFFAVSSLTLTRDVFAVGAKHAEFTGRVNAGLRLVGGKAETYYPHQGDPYECMVLCPGSPTFLQHVLKYGVMSL